jgi:hypothetical protein
MSETNETTLQSYEAHIQEYVEGTPQEVTGGVRDWITASLEGLPQDAKILEFGTAFGRDAAYIEGLGYKVERTDATPGFVDLLQRNGLEARLLNAITDNIPETYDLIFADAVLLHFTRDETRQVAGKVFTALSDGGRFALSLKQGDGEDWSDAKLGAPRFFCYWNKDDIEKVLSDAGFAKVDVGDFDSSGHNNAKWLHIIATKEQI